MIVSIRGKREKNDGRLFYTDILSNPAHLLLGLGIEVAQDQWLRLQEQVRAPRKLLKNAAASSFINP